MNNREVALDYAERRGWPVFPCNPEIGPNHKRPHIEKGFHNASVDPTVITEWWRRWPRALIGVPTGEPIGAVVLDIDIKKPNENGYDTLDILGIGILPNTPLSKPPANGRWDGLFTWDEGCGGKHAGKIDADG
jgi:hypothetical protein